MSLYYIENGQATKVKVPGGRINTLLPGGHVETHNVGGNRAFVHIPSTSGITNIEEVGDELGVADAIVESVLPLTVTRSA